jgi:hypothetical protein
MAYLIFLIKTRYYIEHNKNLNHFIWIPKSPDMNFWILASNVEKGKRKENTWTLTGPSGSGPAPIRRRWQWGPHVRERESRARVRPAAAHRRRDYSDKSGNVALTPQEPRGQRSPRSGQMPSLHHVAWTRRHRPAVTASTVIRRPNTVQQDTCTILPTTGSDPR